MDKDLLKLARNAIRKALGLSINNIEIKESWNERRATFVTLTIDEKLRGCIGSLEPLHKLYQDIQNNAKASALYDPRFPPLSAAEIDNISIEISVLTPLQELKFNDEADILKKIIPFKMGLVLEYGQNRGTFLPQVWEHFPDPKDFFNALKSKAGLDQNFYSKHMKLSSYEVEKCQE